MIPVVVGSSPIGHPILPRRNAAPQKRRLPPLPAGATASASFVANIRAAIAQIRANARGAILGRNPEYLHQLRIGIRRLRSTLRAFRELVRRRRASRIDDELRALLRALGAARDWDVFLESQRAPLLRSAARRARTGARRSAREVLTKAQFHLLLRRTLAWSRSEPWRASADPGAPLGAFGARALQRLYSALRSAAAQGEWSDPEWRHRVRIRLKRLRYGIECFAAGFPPQEMEGFQHRLRAMQHLLGELNDITVQQRLLRQLYRGSGMADPVAGAQLQLAAREFELSGAIAQAWTKLRSHRPHWRRAAARDRG